MFLSRCIFSVFYALVLIFSIGCFYFSVSEGVLAWVYPDEIMAANWAHAYGLFGCAKFYYVQTTVHRLSEGLGVCLAAWLRPFHAMFTGWVFIRLFFYALIPAAMAYFLRQVLNIPLKFSIIIALLLFSTALSVMSAYNVVLIYSLDLASYAMTTITFFILAALFQKSVDNNRCFVWFCVFYALHLNGHEAFLVVSGFFIPLYVWFRIVSGHYIDRGKWSWLKGAVRDRHAQVLLIIYFISMLFMVLSPGLRVRDHAWPATAPLLDGLAYIALCLESVLRMLASYYIFAVLIFLLGIIFRLAVGGQYFSKNKPFYIFLLCAPLIYLAVNSLLFGTHKIYWGGSPVTLSLTAPLVGPIVSDKSMLTGGGALGARQNLFIFVTLVFNIFLSGFLIAGGLRRVYKNKYFAFIALAVVVTLFFLWNPDGRGSLKTVVTFLKGDTDFMHHAPANNSQYLVEGSIVRFFFPSAAWLSIIERHTFPKFRSSSHDLGITSILVNNYFNSHRNKTVVDAAYDLVDKPMHDLVAMTRTPWIGATYATYGVFPDQPCVLFSKEQQMPGSRCDAAFVEKKLGDFAKQPMTASTPVRFKEVAGTRLDMATNCMHVWETRHHGEHFVASEAFHLSKGFYYFVFVGKRTPTSLLLYVMQESGGMRLPWYDPEYGMTGIWEKFTQNHFVEPVFSQTEISPEQIKLRVVLYSAMDQTIYLRWQHGSGVVAFSKGRLKNFSSICSAQYRRINGLNEAMIKPAGV